MWREKLIVLSEMASRAGNSDEFWKASNEALEEHGVSGIGYGIIPYAGDAKSNGFSKASFFKHTYPREWASEVGNFLIDSDITVEMIIDGTPEVFWSDLDLLEEASDPQYSQYEVEKDLGMSFGASLALGRNAFGQAISGIGIWMSDTQSEKGFVEYWQEHRERLRLISHILDEGLRGHHAGLLVPLTPRERDSLTYLAIGFRSAEICWKLKISEKTFEKHIKGAKDKLRARTRDHAIAKALVLNLIQP